MAVIKVNKLKTPEVQSPSSRPILHVLTCCFLMCSLLLVCLSLSPLSLSLPPSLTFSFLLSPFLSCSSLLSLFPRNLHSLSFLPSLMIEYSFQYRYYLSLIHDNEYTENTHTTINSTRGIIKLGSSRCIQHVPTFSKSSRIPITIFNCSFASHYFIFYLFLHLWCHVYLSIRKLSLWWQNKWLGHLLQTWG